MKCLSTSLIILSIPLSICAFSCNPSDINHNTSLPDKPDLRVTVEIKLSLFSQFTPKLNDQSVQDIQVIDDEHVLLLGACPSTFKDCYLQVWGPNGTHPFMLNAELSKYGQAVAISNVLDGRVIVAMESLSDDKKDRSLRILVIDQGLGRISKVIEFIDDSSDGVYSADGAQLTDEEAISRTAAWLDPYYSRVLRSYRLILSDRNKLIISERVRERSRAYQLDLSSENLIQTSLLPRVLDSRFMPGGAASVAEIAGSGSLVAVADVTRDEARILAKKFLNQNFHLVGETLPVMFLMETDGTLVTAQPLHLPWKINFGSLEVAANNQGVVVGGTAHFDGNIQKPFLSLLSFNTASRRLTQVWAHSFEFSTDSEFLSDLSIMENGSILFGGGSGFKQAATGSVLQADDCFLGLVDKAGRLLGWQTFGGARRDFVSFIRKSKKTDRIFLMTQENGALTHEQKKEPLIVGSYWVDFGEQRLNNNRIMDFSSLVPLNLAELTVNNNPGKCPPQLSAACFQMEL